MKIGIWMSGVTVAALLGFSALAQPAAPPAPPPAFQPPQPSPKEPQLLHPLFQDHAVLQRDRPIKVYGEAPAGSVVSVSLANNRAEARAGADGRWSATLPAMPAGGLITEDGGTSKHLPSAVDTSILL